MPCVWPLCSPPPPPPPPPPTEAYAVLATGAILAGGACCVYLSASSRPLGSLSPPALTLLAFAVNVVSVSLPGRFDSNLEDGVAPWPTLFAPAGFAFAIWGLIYLGEACGVAAVWLRRQDKPLQQAAAAASRGWLASCAAQALWCVAFRPWALSRLWLSAALLAVDAIALLSSQRAFYAQPPPPRVPRALVGWPRSLHLGWLSAAALVNLNAFVGHAALGAPAALAAAALSLAAALAAALAYVRLGLPAAALAVAWALFGLSQGAAVGRDAAALGPAAVEGLYLAYLVGALAVLLFLPLTAAPAAPPRPQVRVGVGVIAQRQDGRLLMGERLGAHGANKISFPGGHVEMGESWEQTALRELAEETGLVAPDATHVATTNDVMPGDNKHYVTFFMLVRLPAGAANPVNLEPEKCGGWSWYTWDEIKAIPEDRLFVPVVNLLASGYKPPLRFW